MHRRAFLTLAGASVLPLPAWAVRADQGLFVHAQPRPLPPLDIRDGDSRPAADWRGRPLLMNLWASWCAPCVAELPALDRLKPQAEAEGMAVMALCLDRSGAVGAVNTYARLGIKSLAVHVDGRRNAGELLAAQALPTTLLIDGAGREVARYVGAAAWDSPQALALLRALKAARPLDGGLAPPPVRAGAAL